MDPKTLATWCVYDPLREVDPINVAALTLEGVPVLAIWKAEAHPNTALVLPLEFLVEAIETAQARAALR